MKKLIKSSIILLSLILTGCQNGDSGLIGGPPDLNQEVASIGVTPARSIIPVPLTQQYGALATLTNEEVISITDNPGLSWKSSDTAIATIDDNGLATGIRPGITTITISGTSNGELFTDKAELIISNPVVVALTISAVPVNGHWVGIIPVNYGAQYEAIATYSDKSTHAITSDIHWQSSNSLAAPINETGYVNGLQYGETIISATYTGIASKNIVSNDEKLKVADVSITNIELTPLIKEAGVDEVFEYKVIATTVNNETSEINILDVTKQAEWEIEDSDVITIDSEGVATALAEGTSTVQAVFPEVGLDSDIAEVNVVDFVERSLVIGGDPIILFVGDSTNLTATYKDKYGNDENVTDLILTEWSSNDDLTVTVSTGVSMGQAIGTADITSWYKNINSEPFTVEVKLNNYGGANCGDIKNTECILFRPLLIEETAYNELEEEHELYITDDNGVENPNGNYSFSFVSFDTAAQSCADLGNYQLVSDANYLLSILENTNNDPNVTKWPTNRPYWTSDIVEGDVFGSINTVALDSDTDRFYIYSTNPISNGLVVCEPII